VRWFRFVEDCSGGGERLRIEMSVRRATLCLGKIPDKSSRSGPSSHGPASPLWPGRLSIPSSPLRLHDERETSKLISSPRVSSPAHANERLYRSRETVKAWLESSPTSVLDDHHHDGDISAHSSLESYNSSPVGSPYRRSASSSRFLSPCPSVPRQAGLLSPCSSTTHQPGHVRVSCPIPNQLNSAIFFSMSVFEIVRETHRVDRECRFELSRRLDVPPRIGIQLMCRGLMQPKAPTSCPSLARNHKV